MKRSIFFICTFFALAFTANAQTVSWETYPNSTSGYSLDTTSTSLEYDSDILYIHCWRDSGGLAFHYYIQTKNIPDYTSPNKFGEAQIMINQDDGPTSTYVDRHISYNYYVPGWENESYPTTGSVFSGTINLTDRDFSTLYFNIDDLFSDNSDTQYSGLTFFATLN